MKAIYHQTGALIERGQFKAALETIFALIRHLNKYFDEKKPWISVKQDKEDCQKVLYTCTLAIANLSVILQPFLPFSCLRIQETLKLSADEWAFLEEQSFTVQNVKPLFERIDPERIVEETEKLKK